MYENVIYWFWVMYIYYDKVNICKYLCLNIKLLSYINICF